jgi:hypothetical protein
LTDNKDFVQALKEILEQVSSPSNLDGHAWVDSLHVRNFVADNPEFRQKSAGVQLLAALSATFVATMPRTPPKRGKRLDTQWGEFGILGALYFAPFEFGTVRPDRLVDAWGRIDEVILQFQFGDHNESLSPAERERYSLVGNEVVAAPTSTISDWHIRGLERLAQAFLASEKRLSLLRDEASVVLNPEQEEQTKSELSPGWARILKWYRQYSRQIWLGLILLLVFLLGWKAIRTYNFYRAFRTDVDQLQGLTTDDISVDLFDDFGPLLKTTRADAIALRDEVRPFGWAGRLLGWLPVYGGDLASAGDLLEMATGLIIAADEAYQAGVPLLDVFQGDDIETSIPAALVLIDDAQPEFEIAQEAIADALAARANIEVGSLSQKTRPLLEKIDPFLPLLDRGLPALMALPKVLGGAEFGPQVYLVLIQNEDEIRATGGFITAAAIVTIENGQMVDYAIKDSYDVHDEERFYALAPWQMSKFMGEDYLVFRNVNWLPDFPTTALWAEHLNSYSSAQLVDGVIAIDQEALRLLMTAIGPLNVEGVKKPVSAENVLSLMRVLKDQSRLEGDRKSFIGPLADSIFEELLGQADLQTWREVIKMMLKALDERHILVQVDDPATRELLASMRWDGAMHPGMGDYLMVVDSNMGWNKANAAVQAEVFYQVDLSDPEAPESVLTTRYNNPTLGDYTCRHGYYFNPADTYQDYIERCYWNYLRVYTLTESELLGAELNTTPPRWFYRHQVILPLVDVLGNEGAFDENPDGLQGYGTFLVVPLNEEREASFSFALPPEIVLQTEAKDQQSYRLRIQKQPGTKATPVHIEVLLPAGVQLLSAQPTGQQSHNLWTADFKLRTDIDILLIWQYP